MKRKLVIYIAAFVAVGTFGSCSRSFLEKTPQGQLVTDQMQTVEGCEATLIGAYGLLNGNLDGTWGNYASAPSQWLFGEVGADNAHKGSVNSDQPNMNQIELHQVTSTNDNLEVMWTRCYEGIARCNTTLFLLNAVQNGSGAKFTAERAKEVEAEARFLRGHYYFFLRRLFKNVPYIDENTSTTEAITKSNEGDVYPMIEADFKFAVDNLPATHPQGDIGRPDNIAAKAYLGKVLLYLNRQSEALPLFNDVIASRPSIETLDFDDNFKIATENGPESIFAVQHTINPDGSGDNANVGDMLAGFYGSAPVNCCGFFQPTFDLVNSFRVDANGLPFLDNSYRTNPYKSDFGLTGTAKENYALNQTIAFDPRLDYTVGRRGVPYKDWGVMPGDAWIRDPSYAGPFVAGKHTIFETEFAANSVSGANYVTGLNVNIIRLADVYLMAAECAADANDLDEAKRLVNLIRERASHLPGVSVNGSPAAAYNVGQYTDFPTKEYAMNAIHFERRLELALEGHRYFDLVRWGIAKQVIESYSAFEGSILSSFLGITFDASDEVMPIPQTQIDRSGGGLKQN
ncbi:RagB/SusD family nutrient uptake outer membrane protein [Chitinophaga caeni]|uniref:RagB/SusD family nutrient uptake outer membrane protein n=1 Tax=Chitinophaga caeni TaxID=2029983 RepID=A0A291QX95_9BACT|nr:RagB/SusD family nutrient uptake outer membrane protein [Chitinophaga caeni]ATL48502.1 RagB/SusD family nutrient uptake outer membrane protein [Chitinophaga caeni]